MDYKAIVKAMTDPENQPHQWKDEALEGMFIHAVDEIERLREENAALLRSADDVYKRLMPEIERLREALKFYAAYPQSGAGNVAPWMIDAGKKARAALKGDE